MIPAIRLPLGRASTPPVPPPYAMALWLDPAAQLSSELAAPEYTPSGRDVPAGHQQAAWQLTAVDLGDGAPQEVLWGYPLQPADQPGAGGSAPGDAPMGGPAAQPSPPPLVSRPRPKEPCRGRWVMPSQQTTARSRSPRPPRSGWRPAEAGRHVLPRPPPPPQLPPAAPAGPEVEPAAGHPDPLWLLQQLYDVAALSSRIAAWALNLQLPPRLMDDLAPVVEDLDSLQLVVGTLRAQMAPTAHGTSVAL